MAKPIKSRLQYTLLNRPKSKFNASKFNASKFNIYTVLAVVLTGIAVIVVIVLAVVAARSSRSKGPNVALFNLTAAVEPPSGETLRFVYIGYGRRIDLQAVSKN